MSYYKLRGQQLYGGHKVNINIGDNMPTTMLKALSENISAIIARLGKEE